MSNGFVIEYVDGNLLDAPQKIIVHGCNAQGVMGSGVAKAIREKWPGAYTEYARVHCESGLCLGQVIWFPVDDKLIANAITQEFYGRDKKRYVDYDALRVAFKEINMLSEEIDADVAMPMIGAGLGGGSWTVIENIIETTFKRPVTVYVI
jgi:O-acetyl-ADP-ribose deacetylase (regulator of RNase III)